MPIQSYQDLEVWQRAMDIAAELYRLTKAFPRQEQFGLTSQIRRAASSIPANIAEGWGRQSTGEFRHFLRIAQGSLRELETHLLLSQRVDLAAPGPAPASTEGADHPEQATGSPSAKPEIEGRLAKLWERTPLATRHSQLAERALLALKICDPACGSGHFLIAAANRVAKRLAAIRTGDEEPSPADQRAAFRDVVSHCIYGVDINPMAVELCKVALWLESIDPGRPLSFLDHRILCGNSLIGATPRLLAEGISDGAFKPIEGDDKAVLQRVQSPQQRREEGPAPARLWSHA